MNNTLKNILWLLLGGFMISCCYFAGALILMMTIVGILPGIEAIKIAIVCLWPFGTEVRQAKEPYGCCLIFPFHLFWLLYVGFALYLIHLCLGAFFYITYIGRPLARKHFEMCKLALYPFGYKVDFQGLIWRSRAGVCLSKNDVYRARLNCANIKSPSCYTLQDGDFTYINIRSSRSLNFLVSMSKRLYNVSYKGEDR